MSLNKSKNSNLNTIEYKKVNKKDIVTIGVDSSSTNCGIAIFNNGDLVKTCNYPFPGTFDINKLTDITHTFDDLFSKYKPNIVVLERTAPARNSKTLTMLNQVSGAIQAIAIIHGAFVDDIHNKTIKKYLNIKTKEDSINKVKELYNIKVKTDHESDAILTVEAYRIYMENNGECTNKR